jgi:hypothetical protein
MSHFAISALLLRNLDDDTVDFQLMLMPIEAKDTEVAQHIALQKCHEQYPDHAIKSIIGIEMEQFIYRSRSVH